MLHTLLIFLSEYGDHESAGARVLSRQLRGERYDMIAVLCGSKALPVKSKKHPLTPRPSSRRPNELLTTTSRTRTFYLRYF